MSKIIVYGMPAGTSFRVHWALHELSLPYETKSIDFKAGEHKSPAFLAINPMGQIPAIDVDGFKLTESIAITHYLAAKFNPALLGATVEDQAQAMRWSVWNMLNVNPSFGKLASVAWTKQELEPAVKEEQTATIAKMMPILEAQLAGKEYILGTFSLADIDLRATFMYAEMASVDLSSYPNIVAWMARCAARPTYLSARNG